MAGRRGLSRRSFLQMTMLGLGASLIPKTSAQAAFIDHPTAGSFITEAEFQLAQLINQYRAEHGLPAIPLSKSLTTVAQLHVLDLMIFAPDDGVDSRGMDCNMHSWSNHGQWSGVCYTRDHRYAAGMWDKPKEITGGVYDSPGYEIAYKIFGPKSVAQPAQVLVEWKKSEGHNNVILNRASWEPVTWHAMGVGICGNYASVWFGEISDPLGSIELYVAPGLQNNRVFLPTVRR